METIDFRLATQADNDGILRLMHSIVMPGDIELIYMKSPDFFKAVETQGFMRQVLVACREDGEIVATGVRALRRATVNGQAQTIGYLGELRISPEARHARVLFNGYKAMKALMTDGQALLHITTIVEGNRNAKAALTWKNRHSSIPNYVDMGLLRSYFIFPFLWKRMNRRFEISHGSMESLDAIVEFIAAKAAQRQFYPLYSREDFLSLRDFRIEDFHVAKENGRTVGVAALWNQTGFKQILVNKYNGKMRLLKRLFSHFLPGEGEVIANACVSFIAIQDDRAEVLQAILSHIYNDVRRTNVRYFMLCMHESDPLNDAVRHFPRLTYRSRLYIADYEDEESIRARIDGRIPYVEVAAL